MKGMCPHWRRPGGEDSGTEDWGRRMPSVFREAVLRERNNRENWGKSHLPGESIPYLSPVRFLPSIITLLNIRLIRVW